jgi:DNA-binding response OmpR family regulator
MKARPRLLVVEDDLSLQETLGEGLEDSGFEVVVADNGTEAIAELDSDASQFEEVITDVDLGTGPDGWEVGRRARERDSDMPVVYMSGASTDWPMQGVANSVFVAKPFTLAQMVNAHDVALAAGRAPPSAPKAPGINTTYKVVEFATASTSRWGIVATSMERKARCDTLYETKAEAQAEADRATAEGIVA